MMTVSWTLSHFFLKTLHSNKENKYKHPYSMPISKREDGYQPKYIRRGVNIKDQLNQCCLWPVWGIRQELHGSTKRSENLSGDNRSARIYSQKEKSLLKWELLKVGLKLGRAVRRGGLEKRGNQKWSLNNILDDVQHILGWWQDIICHVILCSRKCTKNIYNVFFF